MTVDFKAGARPLMLTDPDFHKFANLVYQSCGIKITPAKKTMLSGRLMKRMRKLELTDFNEYYDLVTGKGGSTELVAMIDVVTTNKTDFFREPKHFEFLAKEVLPPFCAVWKNKSRSRTFRIWSAGCSTGMEPYTLAVVLMEFAARAPEFMFTILASDISVNVLEKAQLGIYPEEVLAPVPPGLLHKYFLRGKAENRGLVRVCPELRKKIHFRRVNLLDGNNGEKKAMDVIFCRNVIIYFDRNTQYRVLANLCRHLEAGGLLFLGHSETVTGLGLPLKMIAPTVYQLQ